MRVLFILHEAFGARGGIAQFNRDFLADVSAAKKAGKSVDDVANSWKIPAKYVGYAAAAPARLKANVQIVFDEVK